MDGPDGSTALGTLVEVIGFPGWTEVNRPRMTDPALQRQTSRYSGAMVRCSARLTDGLADGQGEIDWLRSTGRNQSFVVPPP
jgi:hypothetical protein